MGGGLVTIMDSVKSKELSIWSQSLGSEETKAMVQAMDSRVERVELNMWTTLDIRDLMEYNGQGRCRKVKCTFETKDRYREQLRTWAMSRNWTVTDDDKFWFIIERI